MPLSTEDIEARLDIRISREVEQPLEVADIAVAIAYRQMRALESLAADLAKIVRSNPNYDHYSLSHEEWRKLVIGDANPQKS